MVALTSSNYCSICYSDRCPGSNVYLLFLPSAWCFKKAYSIEELLELIRVLFVALVQSICMSLRTKLGLR